MPLLHLMIESLNRNECNDALCYPRDHSKGHETRQYPS